MMVYFINHSRTRTIFFSQINSRELVREQKNMTCQVFYVAREVKSMACEVLDLSREVKSVACEVLFFSREQNGCSALDLMRFLIVFSISNE